MRRIQDKDFLTALINERELWLRMCQREVIGRYRGSLLGWGWSLLNPILMLGVYTFVFSQVFKATWGNTQMTNQSMFAINLFAGLIVFNLFGECAIRAPTLIVNNANYVNRVIFPLEVLAPVTVAAATFHALTGMIILGAFEIINGHGIPTTMLWLPITWLPLLLGCLGLTWLLSALGAFVRDLGQVTGVAVNVLIFMSAVFYPLSSLPAKWQPLLELNPLVHVIEQTRRICINGQAPSPLYLIVGIATTWLGCELCFRIFQRARRGFADVL